MISKKSLLITITMAFFINNVSMAEMCARLKRVSGGENHTLALMDDNTLWACGDNGFKQLGLGSNVPYSYTLDQVLGEDGEGVLQDVATFDAGWYHSLAADINGTLWAWGTDEFGLLGNGPNEVNWNVPKKVHGIDDVGYLSDTVDIVYVSAGRSGTHSLVVDSDGYVYGFGYNAYGQCGDGTKTNRESPVLVLDDDPNTNDPNTVGIYLGDIAFIIQADAGVAHSIALDDEGHVWHWGAGSSTETYPEKVKTSSSFGWQELSNIIQISSCAHSVAVDSNGNVWEWSNSGVAYGGAYGAYKVLKGEMDTASGYLEDIVEVGAGEGYSMARTSDGYVLVWNNGQSAFPEYVEDGEMDTESGLLEGIISIGAGFTHKMAICENGYGWAWGNNVGGKLGVGDTDPHPEPTQMWCAEVSSSIYLTKTAEIQGSEPDCAQPFIDTEDNYLVYEVSYGNPVTDRDDPNYYGTVYDVDIVDHLPFAVDFDSVTGGGVYNPNTHTVTWTIDDDELNPGDSGSFTLTTKVNNYARPGGEISNFVEMISDNYYSYATEAVSVCNWGSEIIYVDKDASGFNNGTSWDDAYMDLRDAFTGARNLGADVTAIWVAAGTYKPVYDMGDDDAYRDATFELLEDLGLFGHFGGVGTYETSTSQRNFADSNNETILEGQIDPNYAAAVKYIVKAEDIENAVLDGFTIRGSYYGAGIYLDDADVSIVNCKLKNNHNYGIDVTAYSYPDVHNCVFMDNSSQGMRVYDHCWPEVSYCTFDGNDTTSQGINQSNYSVVEIDNCLFNNHTSYGVCGSGGNLTVDHSVISHNGDNGIYASSGCDLTLKNSVVRYSGEHGIELHDNLVTTIKNNWIHNNGTKHYAYYGGAGICFNNQSSVPLVRNNTIYDNWTYGLESSEYGADPNVINCIIYGNDTNDFHRENGTFDTVNYCNLQNSHDGIGNITGDPGFKNVATDPDDLHLDEASQCKNAGDPGGSYDETDIDGENRVYYGRVDIGGDEYYWSAADFDEDGAVNLIDYVIFAAAWLTDSEDGNYNENCDLEDDNSIDINDLTLFCEDWLWEKVWDEGWMMCMGGGGMGFEVESISVESSKTALTDNRDTLMLSTATESLETRPERLRAKSQKFYDIIPSTTITARQEALDAMNADPVSIKELLQWLDKIWLDGDLKEFMTEEEYLEFRKAIEEFWILNTPT